MARLYCKTKEGKYLHPHDVRNIVKIVKETADRYPDVLEVLEKPKKHSIAVIDRSCINYDAAFIFRSVYDGDQRELVAFVLNGGIIDDSTVTGVGQLKYNYCVVQKNTLYCQVLLGILDDINELVGNKLEYGIE